MKYSNESINTAKKICAKVFENAAKERDAARMASKISDPIYAKEVYHTLRSGK